MSRRKPNITIAAVVLAALVSLCGAKQAWGFAFWEADNLPNGYTDVVNEPNNRSWWDKTSLTYKFSSGFTTNNAIRDQVRLAFDQWDDANATAQGSNYSYNRAGGWRDFVDIRSVAVHEIGHVLGLRHPNQAWSSASQRNYRPSGATYVKQADNGNEVMRSWINEGDYNHVLSHDELDAFDFSYGHDLSFSEITSGTPDITISTYSTGASTWAEGGWSGVWRNNANHAQGLRSTSGYIKFNTNASSKLGFQKHAINWDYQNTSGKSTAGMEVRTTGTNNLTPTWRFDGYSPAATNNQFHAFTVNPVGANAKDDLVHTWGAPYHNGSPGNFPAGDIIHIGLGQDVWDWSVVSAKVLHSDGTKTSAPLLGIHGPWNDTVSGVSLAADGAASGADGDITDGGVETILARGIRLLNSDVPVTLTDLFLMDVTDLNLRPEDMNGRWVEQSTLPRLRPDDMLGPITLEAGDELILAMEGEPQPGQQRRVLHLPDPALLDGQLLVVAETQTADAVVGTYALIDNAPIVVPEPSTILLAAMGLIGLFGFARRRQSKVGLVT